MQQLHQQVYILIHEMTCEMQCICKAEQAIQAVHKVLALQLHIWSTAAMKTALAQHSTAQHSTAQHSAAQHSTAQRSTAQHSEVQRITADSATNSTAQCCRADDNACL